MDLKKGFIVILAGGLLICFTIIKLKFMTIPDASGHVADKGTISEAGNFNSTIDENNGISMQEDASERDIENIVYFKGDLQLPDENILESGNLLNTYDNEMLMIDDSFSPLLLSDLSENGWGEYSFEVIGEGAYSIKTKKQGSIITDKDEFLDLSEAFINDSGLKDFLTNHDITMEYEVEGRNGQYSAFCYLLYDTERTGSYVRMNFEQDKICTECQMYLYKSVLIERLPVKSFDTAMENAFYINPDAGEKTDYKNYLIKNVDLKYVNGLPYYTFSAYGADKRNLLTGYALAVEIDGSENRIELLENYYSFQ